MQLWNHCIMFADCRLVFTVFNTGIFFQLLVLNKLSVKCNSFILTRFQIYVLVSSITNENGKVFLELYLHGLATCGDGDVDRRISFEDKTTTLFVDNSIQHYNLDFG